MLCRAKAICCERPKELGGSRTSTADLNWPLASHVIRHHAEAVLQGGGSSSHSLSVFRGWTGHQSGDSEQMLVNHLLYTFIYIYVFFLISILVNSFILSHESYFVFFSSAPPISLVRGGWTNDCVVLSYLPGETTILTQNHVLHWHKCTDFRNL